MGARSPLKAASTVGQSRPGRREDRAWGLGSPHGNEGHIPRLSSASSPHWPQLVVGSRTGALLGGLTHRMCLAPKQK